MSGKKGRVTKSTYNVLIKSFSQTGITKNQNGDILVRSTMKIRREAVTAYLNNPLYTLN